MATQIHVVSPEDNAWHAGYADGRLFMSGPDAPTRGQSAAAAVEARDPSYEVTLVKVRAGTPFSAVPQAEADIPEDIVVSRTPLG